MLVKKELATISLIKPDVRSSRNSKKICVAKTVELPRSGMVLVADFYYDSKLSSRFFTDGIGYLTVHTWPAEKWTKDYPASIGTYGYHSVISSPATDAVVQSFLGKTYSYAASYAARIIYSFIYAIWRRKREAAIDAKYALMKKHFSMFPNLPENLVSYCEDSVFQHTYIFLDKLDKKGRRPARCGHCGARYFVPKDAKHNSDCFCQSCGKKAIYKATWYHQFIEDKSKVFIAHKVDNQLIYRWTEVSRTYSHPNYHRKYFFEDYAYNLHLYTPRGPTLYSYRYMYNMGYVGKNWFRRANGEPCIDKSYIYTDNLREVFGERFYNVDLQAGLSGKKCYLSFHELINNLRDNPAAEYLFKLGMPTLAGCANRLYEVGNDDKPGFAAVLGISKSLMPLYQSKNISFNEHSIIRAYAKWVSREDVENMRMLGIDKVDNSAVVEILSYISLKRFLNYIRKQCLLYPKMKIDQLVTTYRDYLDMSAGLGVDLSRKSVKLPADCVDAHNQILGRFNKVKFSAEDTLFAEKVKCIYEKLAVTEFEKDGFCIVLPQLRSDLITEGQSLKHCVGTDSYYKQHIAGTNLIIFVRQISRPDRPFFTMQLSMDGFRILQLYGFGDRSAPSDVRRFANSFVAMLKESSKMSRRKSA